MDASGHPLWFLINLLIGTFWVGRDPQHLKSPASGFAQNNPGSHTVCLWALSTCFLTLTGLVPWLLPWRASIPEWWGPTVLLQGCLYPACSLGWDHSQRGCRARHPCFLEERRFTRCRREAGLKFIIGEGVNRRSKQLRKGSEGLD